MDKPLLNEALDFLKRKEDPTSLGLDKMQLSSTKMKGLENLIRVLSKEQLTRIYNTIKEMQ